MRWLYRLLVRLGQALGTWVVGIFAGVVAAGYFLLRPGRVATSLRFYRALDPGRSLPGRLRWAWSQFQGFAALYSERLLLRTHPERLGCTMEGLEHLDAAVAGRGGAVLLMSHVGNWEIAARILGQRGYPLLLYMGARRGEQVEQEHQHDLRQDGIQVLAIPEGQDDFTAGIEGLSALRQGRLVSLAGDRSDSPSHQRVEGTLLGHRVSVPAAPHVLALLGRVPLIVFFAVRTGRRQYRFVARATEPVRAAGRADRREAVRRSAQAYLRELEAILREHPTQWYHFEPFLGPPAAAAGSDGPGPARTAERP